MTRHRLTATAADFDLPPDCWRVLREAGVPVDEGPPGDWLGPTLFTSALGSGQLRELRQHEEGRAMDAPQAGWPVIGWVVETQGPPTRYGAYVLEPTVGALWLVDLPPGDPNVWFVSTTLEGYLASLDDLRATWQRCWGAEPLAMGEVNALWAQFAARLEARDPRALSEEVSYFGSWLEEQAERD